MTDKELFEQFYQPIYRTCYYMLKNQHDAEDVCQDIFIIAFKHDYHKIENLKSWMISIAMNTCRNHIRKHKRIWLGPDLWKWLLGRGDTERVKNVVEKIEQRKDVVDLLQKLSPKIREVMLLKYLNEMKNDEIASALDIPLGTVKSRCGRRSTAYRYG